MAKRKDPTMRVDEIMTYDVRSVPPQLSAEDAYQLMRQERVHHLAVIEQGKLVGVLSERDLGSSRGGGARKNRLVVELMTEHAVTATPRTTVRDAANLLRGHVIGCLPVLDKGKVVGIVTVTDLLELLGRGAARQRTESEAWVLKGRGPRKRGALIVASERAGKRHRAST
jgi:acetoin utilization protein AcuB